MFAELKPGWWVNVTHVQEVYGYGTSQCRLVIQGQTDSSYASIPVDEAIRLLKQAALDWAVEVGSAATKHVLGGSEPRADSK